MRPGVLSASPRAFWIWLTATFGMTVIAIPLKIPDIKTMSPDRDLLYRL
jgi:hypothetical protein